MRSVVQAVLLDLKDAQTQASVSAGGFIDDEDSNYDFLRDLARKVGIDQQKLAS